MVEPEDKQMRLRLIYRELVGIVVFGLEVVKKPLFIGVSHVIIILKRIFATVLQRFVTKSSLQQLQLFHLASK